MRMRRKLLTTFEQDIEEIDEDAELMFSVIDFWNDGIDQVRSRQAQDLIRRDYCCRRR